MKTKMFLFRFSLILILGGMSPAGRAQFYFASKSQAFVQTSAGGAIPDPNGAFTFSAEAPTAVSLAVPGGVTSALPADRWGDPGYNLEAVFSTKAALDAAYPSGTYQMTGTGIPALSFNLAAEVYPSATPQVIGGTWNSGGLLVLNPAQANTISLSTFIDYATGGIAGHMRIDVGSVAPGGNNLELEEEVATQPVFGLTARSTPFTSYTIPAGTLASGQAYRVDVNFDTLTTLDTTSVPDSGVVATFTNNLSFYIAAQAPGTSTPAPTITTQPTNQRAPLGDSVTFIVGVSTGGAQFDYNSTDVTWRFNGLQLPGGGRYTFGGGPGTQSLTINNLTAADVGSYTLTLINAGGIVTSGAATYEVGPPMAPVFAVQPGSTVVGLGGSTQLNASVSGATSYQWHLNGSAINGATGSSLYLSGVTTAGLYTVVATGPGGSTTSLPAIVSVASSSRMDGAAIEAGSNILHPVTGNTYDQFLLTGSSATVTADPGQVTRISFIDLNDDIVQVEFAGAGRVCVSLDNVSGPALPVKYNQGITYMKGHATIIASGANETTNLSVFSVGRGNAVNQALFKDVVYDSHADVAVVAVASANGQFGGARTANAGYFNIKGVTGFYAPGVQFQGPVFVGDISAADDARPVYIIGGGSDVRVTGGDLLQANSRPVAVSGITELKFTAGTNSKGELESAQANQARLEQNGVDVTSQLVNNTGQ
jgi:hypothetical protein